MAEQLTPDQYLDKKRKASTGPVEDRRAMLARQLSNLVQGELTTSGNKNYREINANASIPIYKKGSNSVSADLSGGAMVVGNKAFAPRGSAKLTYKRSF
jgi:hypothetical protein